MKILELCPQQTRVSPGEKWIGDTLMIDDHHIKDLGYLYLYLYLITKRQNFAIFWSIHFFVCLPLATVPHNVEFISSRLKIRQISTALRDQSRESSVRILALLRDQSQVMEPRLYCWYLCMLTCKYPNCYLLLLQIVTDRIRINIKNICFCLPWIHRKRFWQDLDDYSLLRRMSIVTDQYFMHHNIYMTNTPEVIEEAAPRSPRQDDRGHLL